ncbi:MAG TPA: DUF2924 domain-containing protein [Polynucleobacter sp.]|nr:DUF2924 domain-containing protein [Polynucleobacter sp.]
MEYSTIVLNQLKFMQAQLAALTQLNRVELMARWQQCFGVSAPHLCRTPLMRQAIAWHLQTQALGGLSLLEKRQIKSDLITPSNKPSNGSRLVRVWQGKTHQVTVLEGGYLYENQTWKSLSAIAKHITGTPWSGPVFFGLKKTTK